MHLCRLSCAMFRRRDIPACRYNSSINIIAQAVVIYKNLLSAFCGGGNFFVLKARVLLIILALCCAEKCEKQYAHFAARKEKQGLARSD